ncbi:thymocyte nuclear protein 1-like [Ornithodoros turicata]|uniref:thymocyte nuclear protein 1-like n=1 Tax=Ornithodoros turicata TaxID=34597 RepID=UPI0031398BF7
MEKAIFQGERNENKFSRRESKSPFCSFSGLTWSIRHLLFSTMPKKRERRESKNDVTPDKDSKKLRADTEAITHWLLKSEPESRMQDGIDVKFGIDDLIACTDSTSCWDGVRNYQARNFMRDRMKEGHLCFFYHSNCKVPAIVGIVEVVKESYPDHTQYDKKSHYYDKSSTKDNPRWFMVDVKFVRKLQHPISLAQLKGLHEKHKASKGPLADMSLLTRSRLSVQPVSDGEWDFILSLEKSQDG